MRSTHFTNTLLYLTLLRPVLQSFWKRITTLNYLLAPADRQLPRMVQFIRLRRLVHFPVKITHQNSFTDVSMVRQNQ